VNNTVASPSAGLTVREVARRLRVSPEKVRNWIKTGRLGAINTSEARCGKPRFVVLPEHLAAFERQRSAGPPPKPLRRQKRTVRVDYYPDQAAG
jgi:excisionase family DNA binding protein